MAIVGTGGKVSAKRYVQEALHALLTSYVLAPDANLTEKEKVKVKEQLDKIKARMLRQCGKVAAAAAVEFEPEAE
jgi:hypothetical protein